jgi:glycosyltransferase involved in cell wall biosynthesis
MRPKIAFIRPHSWPLANVRVADALAAAYPDHDLEVIDVRELLRSHRFLLARNTVSTAVHYWRRLLRTPRSFREAFWRTPYIFDAVGRLVTERLAPQEYTFTMQIQSLFDCHQPGTPHFVYTDHTHLVNLRYADFDQRSMFSPQWIDCERAVYANATLVFARSGHVRDSLIQQYDRPAETVCIVGAGSNVDMAWAPLEQHRYERQEVLFVGIDWNRKGGPDLLEAFAIVQSSHPAARLTIVGAAPEVVTPHCTVVGKVPDGALHPYYEAASVFCLPTKVEPFGVAFLEAMQAGLPIVGTTVGAIPDFVKEGVNGHLVEPGDVAALAEALGDLLDHPDVCREMGARNRALVGERYTWPAVAAAMRVAIDEVLARD